MRNYKKEYVYMVEIFNILPVAPVWFNKTDLNNLVKEFLNK